MSCQFEETGADSRVLNSWYLTSVPLTHHLQDVTEENDVPQQVWEPVAIRMKAAQGMLHADSALVNSESVQLTEQDGFHYVSGSPIHIYMFPKAERDAAEEEAKGMFSQTASGGLINKMVINQKNASPMQSAVWRDGGGRENTLALDESGKWRFVKPDGTLGNDFTGYVKNWKKISEFVDPRHRTMAEEKMLKGATITVEVKGNKADPNRWFDLTVKASKGGSQEVVAKYEIDPQKQKGALMFTYANAPIRLRGAYKGQPVDLAIEFNPDKSTYTVGSVTLTADTTTLQQRMIPGVLSASANFADEVKSRVVLGTLDVFPLIALAGTENLDVTMEMCLNVKTAGEQDVVPAEVSIGASDWLKINNAGLTDVTRQSAQVKNGQYVSSLKGKLARVPAPGEYDVAYNIAVLPGMSEFPQKFISAKPIRLAVVFCYGDVLQPWAREACRGENPSTDLTTLASVNVLKEHFRNSDPGSRFVEIAVFARGNEGLQSAVLQRAEIKLPVFIAETAQAQNRLKFDLVGALHNRMRAIRLPFYGIKSIDFFGHGFPGGKGFMIDTPAELRRSAVHGLNSLGTADNPGCVPIDQFMQELNPHILHDAEIYFQGCHTADNLTDETSNLALFTINHLQKPIWISGYQGIATTSSSDDIAMRFGPQSDGTSKWWCYQRNTYGGSVTRVERTNRISPIHQPNP